MLPKLTFIVPVFNVEDYIEECLISIMNQTEPDIEIIIVNDGSTDKSASICSEYEKKDSRIKVIHKKNEGLGYARNSGLSIALGKYISFVDSDDWIDISFAETVINIMEKYGADLLEFQLTKINNKRNYKYTQPLKIKQGRYKKTDIEQRILKNYLSDKGDRIANSVCTHIYRNDLIKEHGLLFYDERKIYTEDFVFNLQYLFHIESIYVTEEPLYYYRYNNNSLTKSYRINYIQLVLNRDNLVKDILQSRNYKNYNHFVDEKFMVISHSFIFNAFKLYKKEPAKQIVNEFKHILNYPEIQIALKGTKIRELSIKRILIFFLMRYKLYWFLFFLLVLFYNKRENF